jgi:hypothetical protein
VRGADCCSRHACSLECSVLDMTAKIVTVFGLWLAFASVLVLPYDVANTSSSGGGGINVALIWQIVFIILAILIAFIIPFAFFFYEVSAAEEGGEGRTEENEQIRGVDRHEERGGDFIYTLPHMSEGDTTTIRAIVDSHPRVSRPALHSHILIRTRMPVALSHQCRCRA